MKKIRCANWIRPDFNDRLALKETLARCWWNTHAVTFNWVVCLVPTASGHVCTSLCWLLWKTLTKVCEEQSCACYTLYTPALYDLRLALQQMRPNRMSAVNKSPDHRPVGNIQGQSGEPREEKLQFINGIPLAGALAAANLPGVHRKENM